MAIITLTFADTSVADGKWSFDLDAQGSELDNGQATAAYFAAFYINAIVNTPEFLKGCGEFGSKIVAGLTDMNPDLQMPKLGGKAIITMTDQDLETGRYTSILEIEGDELETALPSTAQILGSYVRALLNDQEFGQRVWDFAEEFVANNTGGYIANNDIRPAHGAAAIVQPGNGAGSLAA